MSQHTSREDLDCAPLRGAYLEPVSADVELSAYERADLARRLSRMLAETYSLYLKTVGPIYFNLATLTREEYEALIPAIDETAECIRAIGRPCSARFASSTESMQEGECSAATRPLDVDEDGAEESSLAVGPFTRRFLTVLGLPVDRQGVRTGH